ncbi:hypothetical protein L209DRAFT_781360 [Thermothelomyces heterothallicus CBS 203.75]
MDDFIDDWVSPNGIPETIALIDIDNLKTTVLRLETMDNLLIEMGREALCNSQPNKSIGQGLPTTEAQLRRPETARTAYRDRRVDVDAMKRYVADLPEFEVIWVNHNRSVIRYFTATVEARRIEWELWLEALEKAGTDTWQKAVNLINTLFRALKGARAENRPQFSTEYADTLTEQRECLLWNVDLGGHRELRCQSYSSFALCWQNFRMCRRRNKCRIYLWASRFGIQVQRDNIPHHGDPNSDRCWPDNKRLGGVTSRGRHDSGPRLLVLTSVVFHATSWHGACLLFGAWYRHGAAALVAELGISMDWSHSATARSDVLQG